MTSASIRLGCVLLLLPAVAAAEEREPVRDLDAYAAVGSNLAQSSRLAELGLTDAQLDAFVAGLRAACRGHPVPFGEQARQLMARIDLKLQQQALREQQAFFAQPGKVEEFVSQIAKSLKLERLDSGVAYAIMGGSGSVRPAPEDTVVVSYEVTGPDRETELPQLAVHEKKVKVSELLPGLAEGVQMMTVGSRGMFVLPPDLTYGAGTWPDATVRGAPLIFTVRLHAIGP